MNYNKDTSNKILDSATIEFEEKGYSGARMQSIADRAGINKALLHYYYKSKDALFQLIIQKAINLFIPNLAKSFNESTDFFTGLEEFIAAYIDFLIKHPRIPGFITHEINNNPERVLNLFRASGLDIEPLKQKIKKAAADGLIDDIAPEQLIINVISLSVFPFVAQPIITGIVLNNDKAAYQQLMEARKKEVSQFIIKAIKK